MLNNADRWAAESMGFVNLKLASPLKPSMHLDVLAEGIAGENSVDPSKAGTIQSLESFVSTKLLSRIENVSTNRGSFLHLRNAN